VLTTEWVEGTPVTDTKALDAKGVDRAALAVLTMRTFLGTALEDGFFHADMHQGNLFVDGEGRLVLIDFGIMGRMDEANRRAFARIIYGFIRRDYDDAAQAHFDAGWIPDRFDVGTFATALRSVGEPIFGRTANDMDMSKVLQQLFDVTEVFDMHLRTELVLLQRTMVVVEGVARVLDPGIDLWATAEPVVRGYVAKQVGPRAALRALRQNASAARDLFDAFPEFAAAAEKVAGQLANGGLKLSDETVEKLAAAIRDAGRGAVV
jgi:ubiquinone biosynthesis protein